MSNYWLNVDKPLRSQILHLEDACWDVKRRGAGKYKPVGAVGRDGGWLAFDTVNAAQADAAGRPTFKPLAFCSNCQTIDVGFQALAKSLEQETGAATVAEGTTRDLLAQLTREHVSQALAWIDSGRPNSFSESTKYDLVNSGRRYPPKRVAGLALEVLTGRAFGPDDFKGGEESACFRALRRAGFTVARKEQEHFRPLLQDLEEVLELQTKYASSNTPEMERRGQLIRQQLPKQIEGRVEELEPIFTARGYSVSVEGSDGIGRKSESAWVRIYDEVMSPSATQGWYVVIHFSRDGDYFFLTLGCGATTYRDGFLINIADDVLDGRVKWARSLPQTEGFNPARFSDAIELRGNELSRSFERATAYSLRISPDEFNEEIFWSDVQSLMRRLADVYDSQRAGVDPAAKSADLEALQGEVERAISPNRTSRGQGRGLSGPERVAVERHAMKLTEEALRVAGFVGVRDVSATESCDFKATKDGVDWLIEVKGTTSTSPDEFLLTAAELKLHRDRKGTTALAIVHGIQLARKPAISASGGHLSLEAPWDPDSWAFDPTAFRAKRNPTSQ
jgi:hypothetical protein